jgi:hypothetical protein
VRGAGRGPRGGPGPGGDRVLITQRAGQEEFYREHRLVLAVGGKLARVWEGHEEPGTNWTTTSVLPTGRPDQQDVAVIDVRSAPHQGAQKISASRLHFDVSSGKIVASALPDARSSLFLVQVGRFGTAIEAYRARRTIDCLYDLDVFNAGLFPRLPVRDFLLGALVATRGDAKAALADLRSCTQAPPAASFEYSTAARGNDGNNR